MLKNFVQTRETNFEIKELSLVVYKKIKIIGQQYDVDKNSTKEIDPRMI